MASRIPQWRQARCTLCTAPLLVRDDNEQVVCAACGARLEVLPHPTETRVRHVGEALDAVKGTLEPSAVERALERLKERQLAQAEVLAEPLASARFRRATIAIALLAAGAGLIVIITGTGRAGVLLLSVGLFVLLGALGMRSGMGWTVLESEQRRRERDASRAQQAIAREIQKRERLLAEADVSRGSR
ncbi:MAG TPA: hypothetical protein VGL99_06975 [Chloroflexota bacterium]|jgi:uncharacterized Zn finger protein (UPF0148 family)